MTLLFDVMVTNLLCRPYSRAITLILSELVFSVIRRPFCLSVKWFQINTVQVCLITNDCKCPVVVLHSSKWELVDNEKS